MFAELVTATAACAAHRERCAVHAGGSLPLPRASPTRPTPDDNGGQGGEEAVDAEQVAESLAGGPGKALVGAVASVVTVVDVVFEQERVTAVEDVVPRMRAEIAAWAEPRKDPHAGQRAQSGAGGGFGAEAQVGDLSAGQYAVGVDHGGDEPVAIADTVEDL
nr:hypothetical protein [Actinocatenispora thailandica]